MNDHGFSVAPPHAHVQIWPKFVQNDHYHINTDAWKAARNDNEPIGTCECGHHLYVGRATSASARSHENPEGGVYFYSAECPSIEDGGCGKDYALPNGKILHRSSRHGAQPAGWMGTRFRLLSNPGGR